MTKPRSTHTVVRLTLLGVGWACALASIAVGALERDKKSTAAYLAENRPPEVDVEAPAPAPAGDPTSGIDGSDAA